MNEPLCRNAEKKAVRTQHNYIVKKKAAQKSKAPFLPRPTMHAYYLLPPHTKISRTTVALYTSHFGEMCGF